MGFAKKMVFAWFGVLTLLGCGYNLVWAAAPEAGTFLLKFESVLYVGADPQNPELSLKVNSVFTLEPTEGSPENFSGSGKLVYDRETFRLFGDTGGVTVPNDGVLSIPNMFVIPDGTIAAFWLFPAEPAPSEYLLASPIGPLVWVYNFWAGLFGNFHLDEFGGPYGQGAFGIGGWVYPDANPEGIYATKNYARQQVVEGELWAERTRIDLIPVLEPPRIDKINSASSGTSADDPETGKKT